MSDHELKSALVTNLTDLVASTRDLERLAVANNLDGTTPFLKLRRISVAQEQEIVTALYCCARLAVPVDPDGAVLWQRVAAAYFIHLRERIEGLGHRG